MSRRRLTSAALIRSKQKEAIRVVLDTDAFLNRLFSSGSTASPPVPCSSALDTYFRMGITYRGNVQI